MKKVKQIEKQAVANAAKNPTIPCRTVLANLTSELHNQSFAAASSMTKLATIKQQIYRAMYNQSLYNQQSTPSLIIIT